MKYVIGLDVGGTNIRIGAMDEWNQILASRKVRQKDILRQKTILKDLGDFIENFLTENDLQNRVAAISIGFPATLNKERTIVMQAPNIAGMENLALKEPLERRFCVPIFLEKDVCMAFYYDKRKYHIPDCEILIGCYIGTGIGNIISIDGKLLSGHDGAACEMGHIAVFGSKAQCGCGNIGCIENLAGGKYLQHLCSDVFTDISVEEIFVKKGKHPFLLSFIDAVAVAVSTEINLLNPDYTILSGGVLEMKEFPRQRLLGKIHEHVRKPYPEKTLQLIWASDDYEKGIAGAAFYAREQLDKRRYNQ